MCALGMRPSLPGTPPSSPGCWWFVPRAPRAWAWASLLEDTRLRAGRAWETFWCNRPLADGEMAEEEGGDLAPRPEARGGLCLGSAGVSSHPA